MKIQQSDIYQIFKQTIDSQIHIHKWAAAGFSPNRGLVHCLLTRKERERSAEDSIMHCRSCSQELYVPTIVHMTTPDVAYTVEAVPLASTVTIS